MKDNELTQSYCFEINPMSRTAVHCCCFFFRLVKRLKHRNDLKGNKNYFELAGASSYRGFKLTRVNYSKCMKENQGKSTLVRVSETCSRRSASGVRREIRERGKVRGKRGFFRSLIFAASPRSELLEQARVSEASNYRESTVDGTRYYREFLVGVCRPVLQILTLFQAKKCHFPQPVFRPDL